MNTHNINVDVLIIGAGPSGTVAASYLHNQGHKIKIIEKNKFPRFVIGESLLPRCMDHFEEVGLLDCLKAQNFEVKSGARFLNKKVSCTFDFSEKHTEGWDWTWQVPRADFDSTLANELVKKGVDIEFELEATNVIFNEDGSSVTTVKNKSGEEFFINANFIIDSSGYGRVLPRLLDLEKPSPIPLHSSIFTHLKDVKRPEGKEGTTITFDIIDKDTWFWVIPFSNGYTSIGFVGKNELLDSYTGSTTERMNEMIKLSEYYYDRFSNVPYEFEPIHIKNYSKAVKQLHGKGYALTGNSADFLDPVFSSGVTFATESGLLAAKLISKELNGETVDWDTDYSSYIKEGVEVFSSYVKEWYTGNLQTLFFHKPENPVVKKQICAVLAGYVWDKTNPFVLKHNRIISSMAHLVNIQKEITE